MYRKNNTDHGWMKISVQIYFSSLMTSLQAVILTHILPTLYIYSTVLVLSRLLSDTNLVFIRHVIAVFLTRSINLDFYRFWDWKQSAALPSAKRHCTVGGLVLKDITKRGCICTIYITGNFKVNIAILCWRVVMYVRVEIGI